jgi:diguanylate cyclase (GGDEF)-like protein
LKHGELRKLENNKLKKSITFRYSIALFLIALLSTIAFFNMQKLLKETDLYTYIVNISGAQRMLSQHTALDIYNLNALGKSMADKQYYNYLAQRLNTNATTMLRTNEMLGKGRFFNRNIALSQELRELYFGHANLVKRVEEYATKAKSYLDTQDEKTQDEILNYISLNSEALLNDLNKAVLIYQKEGEAEIVDVSNLETTVWILTLFLLLVEVIVIFQPLTKQLVELTSNNRLLLSNLKQEVEIQTLSLKEANDKLQDLAYLDPLTGLRNRLSLEEDVEKIIKNYEKNAVDYAFLMLDIDFFKDVNDTYGHDVGDFVLKELAKIFKETFREEDKIYRAGGEEFVVLLNRVNLQNSIEIANKLRLKVSLHSFHFEDTVFLKTISGGLFHSSLCELHDYKNVFKFADIALYKAKGSGRNKIEVYDANKTQNEVTYDVKKVTIELEDTKLLHILSVSEEVSRVLEYSQDEFKNLNYFENVVHEDDLDILQTLSTSFTYSSTIRLYTKSHKVVIVRMHAYDVNGRLFVELENSKDLYKNVSPSVLIEKF